MSAAKLEPWNDIHASMTRKEILAHMNSHGVRFLRLQFTDITGHNKNVEVPASQFEKALDGEILFDGSSIEGFTRIEESDMLRPSESREQSDVQAEPALCRWPLAGARRGTRAGAIRSG